MRVLVTASREWPAESNSVIHEVLRSLIPRKGDTMTVVVGDARGGDKVASYWCWAAHKKGWAVTPPEIYPAHWHEPCVEGRCRPGHRRDSRNVGPKGETTICPGQGYYRNERMAAADIDLCVAFIHNRSRGASQCADVARSLGIPVYAYNPDGNFLPGYTPVVDE